MDIRILLIEDDTELVHSLLKAFREHGIIADHCSDGASGLQQATSAAYQAIVLDRMLPMLDGLSVVRQLRAKAVLTPVIYLTTMGGIDDRVQGLEAGGDDYLIKPFAFVELLARVRAMTRRPVNSAALPTRMSVGALEIDLLRRVVTRAGRICELLPQEFRLLEYLMRNADTVVTRSMLLESVWDIHFDPQTSVVESHISRLRAKLKIDGEPEVIQTIRGTGYKLIAPH